MLNSIRTLLNSAIDYAGLFPPANLAMEDAARQYARSRTEAFSWALGRFIVPASRLDELQGFRPDSGWHLSVLLGADLSTDMERMKSFRQRSPASIDAVEVKSGSACEMDRVLDVFANIPVYFELPISEDPHELIAAVAERGARAKVRTGGVESTLFPSPAVLAQFLVGCAGLHVPFKATAGLHHALRSVHPMTYERSSASALMHGFLNVLLGSAAAFGGGEKETVIRILQEEDINSFRYHDGGITWRDLFFSTGRLHEMREHFLFSFGSCSFEEPVSELNTLGLL